MNKASGALLMNHQWAAIVSLSGQIQQANPALANSPIFY
jgi:hypothetical protein